MKSSKLCLWSFLHALAAFVYTTGVAWLLFNGGRLFGQVDNFWGPALLLLLFVLSATIVGALVLGRPILLYLNGGKADSIKLLLCTITWLFLFTLGVFTFLVLR